MLPKRSLRLLFAGVLVSISCSDSTEPGISIGSGRRLFVGEYTACALDNTGKTFCWGFNTNFWEYGSDAASSSIPVQNSAPTLAMLSSGPAQETCGLTTSRQAICWGRGGFGQMGTGVDGPIGNAPGAVTSNEKWADISASRLTVCGVTTSGDGFCWGNNQRGEVGDTALALPAHVTTPHKVIGGIQFASIVAGWTHTCGIATSGATYCWGDNSSGQLGIGFVDGDAHPQPLIVSFTQAFKKLSLSARSTCGITTADVLMCWGYNGTGQLGDGTTNTRSTPTPVASSAKFSDVSMGSGFAGGVSTAITVPAGLAQGGIAHTCGVSTDGTVYCWGWNGAGQVGDGTTITRLSPVAILGGVKMTSVALGGAFSCATGATALWCWGSNAAGQLGNGSVQDSASPVTVIFTWP